jgi:O-antigen/teichoic acid export membrane protein
LSAIKKLASQTAVYGLSSILGRLLNYLLVPLYTNIFLPQEYGVVTELYTYVSFLAVILTYGMETAFFRYAQKEGMNQNSVYATSLISIIVTTCLFLLAGFLMSEQIAQALNYEQHVWYIKCFLVIIAVDAITAIPFAKLRAENKAFRFAGIRLVNIFLNISVNLFFLLLCPALVKTYPAQLSYFYKADIGVGYIFIANLLASLTTVLLLLPQFKIRLQFDKKLWSELIKYALPLLLVGLAGMINETADRVMLKYLLPAGSNVMSEIGIYGACYKISIIMTIFIQTFRYAAEPFFFSHAKNKDAAQLYADVMKYFVIACAAIFLVTLLYLDIVKYFVGKKYWEGLHVVPVLLLANWFLGIYFNLTVWYKLTNKTGYGAGISIFGAVLTIVCNLIFIPLFGYYGAAWTTLICYAAMMLTSYFQGQKHFPINYDLKRIIGYIIFAISLYLLSNLLANCSVSLKLLLNTVLLLFFLGTVFKLEKKQFKSVTL